jgi:hypothetical protein
MCTSRLISIIRMFVAWGSGDCYTQKDSLQLLETVDMGSQLELCIISLLTPEWFLTFCSPEAHFSSDRVNCTRNSHVWDRDTTNIPVMLVPTFWKMNSQALQKMFICERDVACVTSMVEHPVIVVGSSHAIWFGISLADWLIMAVCRIDHHGQWIWTH